MRQADQSTIRRRSWIVWGRVGHCRFAPRKHAFNYPMVTLELDLDDLERGALNSWLFGYDKSRTLSVRRSDYLRGLDSLRSEIETILADHGMPIAPFRITLVTMPRVFGYIFNPVSFFLCFDTDEKLVGCVTQVRNTFGDAHLYPLTCKPQNLPVEWRFPKDFFVSPFFDTSGQYRVVVEAEGKNLSLVVDLFRDGSQVFASELKGTSVPFNVPNLLKTLLRFPLTLVLTMPRIHIQAFMLFVYAKLKPFIRPSPISPYTIHSRQNRIHRARLWMVSQMRSWNNKEID